MDGFQGTLEVFPDLLVEKFIEIFQKNPVNLSNFIDIFINSLAPNVANRFATIPESPG